MAPCTLRHNLSLLARPEQLLDIRPGSAHGEEQSVWAQGPSRLPNRSGSLIMQKGSKNDQCWGPAGADPFQWKTPGGAFLRRHRGGQPRELTRQSAQPASRFRSAPWTGRIWRNCSGPRNKGGEAAETPPRDLHAGRNHQCHTPAAVGRKDRPGYARGTRAGPGAPPAPSRSGEKAEDQPDHPLSDRRISEGPPHRPPPLGR
jgi:hypothetical protein